MIKIMKKAVSVFLILFVLLSVVTLSGCEEKKLTPTEDFFVNDFSGVLDDSAKQTIISMGEKLAAETTAQVVAVTVNSTDGQEIYEYSSDLANEWGIGDKDKDNGVLILLATEDRDVFIATGDGIGGALPESKVGRILDYYAVPDFKEDRFSEGLLKTYKAVVDEVYVAYGITPEDYKPVDELAQSETQEVTPKNVIVSWVILLVLVVVYTFISRKLGILFIPVNFRGGNFRGGGFGGGFGGGGGFSGGGGSFGGGGAGRGF